MVLGVAITNLAEALFGVITQVHGWFLKLAGLE